MALPLQTQSLVDGQWITRTIDAHTLLQHHNQMDDNAADNTMETIRPPVRGVLTQTIIQSPLVHWILPIRLRGQEYNDVAFIGDTFVEIRRLGVGPHLSEVIRKDDFGSRIRNASVLGSLEDHVEEQVDFKEEPEDVDMINPSASPDNPPSSTVLLPPQILVLQLEVDTSSDSVFLMLHQSNDGSWRFISSRRRLSKAMDKLQPGMHLSIDPSSRYMAIGSSEQCFTVQAFNTRTELNRQYAVGEELRFIESERIVLCKGAILKLEFLHPPAGSDDIILLLIMALNGKIRMLLYSWRAGDPLSAVRTRNSSKKGYVLNDIPLLIIPLRFQTAFILVNDRSMAVYKGILEGAPECILIGSFPRLPNELYQGSDMPLWTAWAKPTRLPYHKARQDDVYLAREDGHICLLEVNYDNEDPDLTPSLTDVGRMQCNIGQAFTCVDYSLDPIVTRHGDVLVAGGDASIGGTYLNRARAQPNVKKDTQNWSPATDLVAIRNNSKSNLDINTRPQSFVPVPDLIFVCSGKGARSSITELRYGIEAILGLNLEFRSAVTKAWVLPSEVYSGLVDGDDWVLLSLEDHSAVLQISADWTSAEELDPKHTQLDMKSRTIVTGVIETRAMQVTEQSIIILDSGRRTIFNDLDMMGFPQASSISASSINDAVICSGNVLFTTHHKEQRLLRILEPVVDNSIAPPTILYAFRTIRSWTRDGPELTCIAMCEHPQNHWGLIVAGARKDGEISLLFITRDEFNLPVPTIYEGCSYDLRALSSIVIIPSSTPDNFTLLCGTLTGLVISLGIVKSGQEFHIHGSRCDRFGGSVATLTIADQVGESNCLFVNCDEKVFKMTLSISSAKGNSFVKRPARTNLKADQIWLVDALDTTLQQPNINSILPLRSESSIDTDLLLISHNRLLLARMGIKRKTVPRRIPIKGTPYRIIHSETRNAFVVGASTEGRSTLYFIDPKTGEDLSDPRGEKRGAETSFVAGLGHYDDKILCIYEWLYSHDAYTWNFLVVCTSSGRVLIICTNNDDSSRTSSGRAKISFWTVTQFKNFTSVYSVVGDSEGLYYCAKSDTEVKLYYSTLNKENKKFNNSPAEAKLLSPAISLSYDSGKIYALTRHHSLQILKVIKTDGKVQLRHTHTDQLQRESLHHLNGRPNTFRAPDKSQIDLVSDRSKSVVGLCASSGMKVDTLDTIFEAQLPTSVLRFRSANCRPVWDSSWKVHRNEDSDLDPNRLACLGVIHNDETNSETLGMGIDGSLYHLTMLDLRTWQFLKFLANLARSSGLVGGRPWEGSTELEPEQNPQNMQVDGDILKRVVENKKLEELFRVGQHQTDENKKEFQRFCELLEMMHEGKMEKDDNPLFYVEQAYVDLEVFLRPVI
ncbi:hypothetical protein SBOR_0908 [Sclerotinia borealis F-4128]|uniref:RSE1/DDB1/CPSF1 first beta-propeller domain-containing protein n=1 Tax=Sclerotinia borealis (strain F-4128) TaxID=1432307 RepID=W9CVU1_SCLBF|nr:hypothetical protein SBOR_0908 [Sclerotinia borealis F-4128]